MNMLEQKVDALTAFHNDEDGLETIQVVMIVAVAAIVLIALIKFWDQIKNWVKGIWSTLTGQTNNAEQFPT
jgi:Flp pilus assembly pilin Flp